VTIQVSTTDARTAKALELLSGADKWLKITSKANGRRYYVVPGFNGALYWANLVECTCPDHTRRGTRRGTRCKHIIAVALHVSRVNTARRLAPKAVRVPLVARLSA
jgi:predicted nucleic acid-binding Zn finger protein